MSDSELLDFASRDPGEPGGRPRRRLWRPGPLALVLLVAVVGLPLAAAWVHLGRVHESDVAVFEAVRVDFLLVDGNAEPLLHGESPPCEESDDFGVLTRTYSPETGPTLRQLRDALRLVGFSTREPSRGAVLTMTEVVDRRIILVEVTGEAQGPDARGFSLRATSPATALACRFGD